MRFDLWAWSRNIHQDRYKEVQSLLAHIDFLLPCESKKIETKEDLESLGYGCILSDLSDPEWV